jgi:hypothetical protein
MKVPAGKWSFRYACCVKCDDTKSKHRGHGLCRVCYAKVKPQSREQTRVYQKNYRIKHPTRVLESQRSFAQRFKKERGAQRRARWFRGVEVKDSIFGIGTVQGRASRAGGEWTVEVKFGKETMEMPTRELTRTGFCE